MNVSRLALTILLILTPVLCFAEDSFHDKKKEVTSDGRPPADSMPKPDEDKASVAGAIDSIAQVSDMLQGRTRKAVGERTIPSDFEYFPGQIRP